MQELCPGERPRENITAKPKTIEQIIKEFKDQNKPLPFYPPAESYRDPQWVMRAQKDPSKPPWIHWIEYWNRNKENL